MLLPSGCIFCYLLFQPYLATFLQDQVKRKSGKHLSILISCDKIDKLSSIFILEASRTFLFRREYNSYEMERNDTAEALQNPSSIHREFHLVSIMYQSFNASVRSGFFFPFFGRDRFFLFFFLFTDGFVAVRHFENPF